MQRSSCKPKKAKARPSGLRSRVVTPRADAVTLASRTQGALRAASGAQRRWVLGSLRALVATALLAAGSVAQSAELRTIAILDFDLVDDQHELAPATVEYQRLPAIRDQLQSAFAANGLYRVVDIAPARAKIDGYLARTQIRDCNGCELDIGR